MQAQCGSRALQHPCWRMSEGCLYSLTPVSLLLSLWPAASRRVWHWGVADLEKVSVGDTQQVRQVAAVRRHTCCSHGLKVRVMYGEVRPEVSTVRQGADQSQQACHSCGAFACSHMHHTCYLADNVPFDCISTVKQPPGMLAGFDQPLAHVEERKQQQGTEAV